MKTADSKACIITINTRILNNYLGGLDELNSNLKLNKNKNNSINSISYLVFWATGINVIEISAPTRSFDKIACFFQYLQQTQQHITTRIVINDIEILCSVGKKKEGITTILYQSILLPKMRNHSDSLFGVQTIDFIFILIIQNDSLFGVQTIYCITITYNTPSYTYIVIFFGCQWNWAKSLTKKSQSASSRKLLSSTIKSHRSISNSKEEWHQ